MKRNDFMAGYPARIGQEGLVNFVVEIPAGTVRKWEVNKDHGGMKTDLENGKPRHVQYLGYPGNYGMIPSTLSPKERGGDGDPLDVIVPGPPMPRGTVMPVRVVGVLRLLDRGEHDDKLVAVATGTSFEAVRSLDELRDGFPGVLEIIETWFVNYKGPGKMESLGLGDEAAAQAILEEAIQAYRSTRQA